MSYPVSTSTSVPYPNQVYTQQGFNSHPAGVIPGADKFVNNTASNSPMGPSIMLSSPQAPAPTTAPFVNQESQGNSPTYQMPERPSTVSLCMAIAGIISMVIGFACLAGSTLTLASGLGIFIGLAVAIGFGLNYYFQNNNYHDACKALREQESKKVDDVSSNEGSSLTASNSVLGNTPGAYAPGIQAGGESQFPNFLSEFPSPFANSLQALHQIQKKQNENMQNIARSREDLSNQNILLRQRMIERNQQEQLLNQAMQNALNVNGRARAPGEDREAHNQIIMGVAQARIQAQSNFDITSDDANLINGLVLSHNSDLLANYGMQPQIASELSAAFAQLQAQASQLGYQQQFQQQYQQQLYRA